MEPLTHTLLTCKLIGKETRVLVAGVGPDISFYLTYPLWMMVQEKSIHTLTTVEWPDPPQWMEILHHACHSLPVALAGAVVVRILRGQWPRRELMAWSLHIIVDVPTHSRRLWGPRFLWPLSNVVVNGVSWVEIASRMIAISLQALSGTIEGPQEPHTFWSDRCKPRNNRPSPTWRGFLFAAGNELVPEGRPKV